MREKNNLNRKKSQNVVLISAYATIFINSELSKAWPIFVISALGMAITFEH